MVRGPDQKCRVFTMAPKSGWELLRHCEILPTFETDQGTQFYPSPPPPPLHPFRLKMSIFLINLRDVADIFIWSVAEVQLAIASCESRLGV